MALPAAITPITVSGKYIKADGSPAVGQVLFTPSLPAATAGALMPLSPLALTLDAGGAFSVILAATDDPDWVVSGFTYQVTEKIYGTSPRTYYISVPAASAGGAMDLALAAPTTDPETSDVFLAIDGGTIRGVVGTPRTFPKGPSANSKTTGIDIASSYAGGDDNGSGTDSTGRINLYSYQRANSASFGETVRKFAMRSDAKSMEAFYIPVDGTKKAGYNPTTRDPKTSGVSWKPVVWQGSHYEANDHGSIHGHWELEIADSTGALQGRLEVPFIDQAVDGTKTLDQATVGVDYTNIRTNLSDFSVRAQSIASGAYSGQTTCLRVGGNNSVSKEIHLSIASDMGTGFRRWVMRATNETETGSNAGTNWQLTRYDDTGVLIDSPIVVSRSTGNVTLGPGIVARRATSTVSTLSLNTTSLGSGQGVIAIANAAVAPSATPTGGGVLYVESGALKYKGSSGTVTVIAPA